ncbi:putative TLC domain-containing protein [Rosellinia necatrix]|uniref:Putative TLC domain-containing protein n=1 Tax=Rosellinia necatrix TaxID=77044 RepID=A0A1W2THA2_ROSNE|nr:putative TLC domain-containing protein [Rosellinia necatrix]
MEACDIVSSSTDLLHPTMHKRNPRIPRLSAHRDQDIGTRETDKPTGTSQPAKRKRRSRGRDGWTQRRWAIPLALVVLVLSVYALSPTDANIAHPLIFLSYKISGDDDDDIDGSGTAAAVYGKGPRDAAFVAFYTAVLFAARELLMAEVLRPLAAWHGIASRARRARFDEQAYVALYTAAAGPLGLCVMRGSPAWYFSTPGLYAGYPHRALGAPAKAYYLVQAAFWAQQALVMLLGLERRRRDFRELVAHHLVTLSLIALSYRFHFTMMGVLVYITHDISDFFLATSKCLNYIDSPLQGPYYALCVAVWVYLRHYINLKILLSVLTEFRTIGPYVLDWEAGQYKCALSAAITFALLAALQALNLYWLYCLLRNGYRFVVFGIAKDDREEEDDKEDDQQTANLAEYERRRK